VQVSTFLDHNIHIHLCQNKLYLKYFFLNNQPDALIIQIYSVIERYMSESGWNILTLLGSGHQNLRETYQCRMYSGKLLMMGKEDARNM